MKLIFDYKFRFYTSKMNEICLHCHWLYFSSIILCFGQCVLQHTMNLLQGPKDLVFPTLSHKYLLTWHLSFETQSCKKICKMLTWLHYTTINKITQLYKKQTIYYHLTYWLDHIILVVHQLGFSIYIFKVVHLLLKSYLF